MLTKISIPYEIQMSWNPSDSRLGLLSPLNFIMSNHTYVLGMLTIDTPSSFFKFHVSLFEYGKIRQIHIQERWSRLLICGQNGNMTKLCKMWCYFVQLQITLMIKNHFYHRNTLFHCWEYSAHITRACSKSGFVQWLWNILDICGSSMT